MAEIKGTERNLQWTILAAFRYCSNRHLTKSIHGVDTVILDNLHLIGTAFIQQMINDIEWEQRAQEIDEEEQQKEKDDFFYRLKAHVGDYMRYMQDMQDQKQNKDAQKLYSLLNDVMEACKTVKVNRPTPWWRQVEDTSYLTPLLNKLREEVERREQNGEQ
jgi:hypothetical protein|uniref:Uncharacterized protein n=1 Tax=Myoviridae sp. ctxpQ22 TaxID=2826715 RepID=A0A8S5N464_9CAUD|nr:MAG TPA: hypothetical protein [Myoviridae sp. ctxpQ22]